MKKLSFFLIAALIVGLFAGCAGTPVVYYSDCTCPVGSHDTPTQNTTPDIGGDGTLKTGLYVGTKISDSKSAAGEENGAATYDVTVIAVTVDDAGVIHSCIIDSVPATVAFDANGMIVSDLTAEILSKNELGDNYGMKAASDIGKEWNEQVAALADYAVGKTVEELKNGAINESGKAKDADLASSATIYLGGYVSGIEAAANNARHLGAKTGDELRLAVIPSVTFNVSADSDSGGTVQFDMDVTALTLNDNIITSCYIDSLQANISFDASGTINTDLTAPVLTKNQLGESYGMKAISAQYGIGKEWNEQAAAFAEYVTGKTVEEVAGIAVSEGKPSDADLAASVTIAIGGFQKLIAKAAE